MLPQSVAIFTSGPLHLRCWRHVARLPFPGLNLREVTGRLFRLPHPARAATTINSAPDSSISAQAGSAMDSGSPRRPRGAPTPKSPNTRSGAAGVAAQISIPDEPGLGAEVQPHPAEVVQVVEAPDAGDAPPPAKRARKERQPRGGKNGALAGAGAGAGATEAAEGVAVEGSSKPSPARPRKSRSKAAAQAPADVTTTETGGDGGGAEELLGARTTQPKKPQARGKRGQKAEPLPQYTAEEMRRAPPAEGTPLLKILSWNVAGLRALMKKQPDALSSLVAREGVEVVCLQEHKLQDSHTAEMAAALGLKGWSHHWACSTSKLGYSGVSVHTRTKPLSVSMGLGACGGSLEPDPEHDLEGRVVTVELPEAFVVSVYVPNSGEGLKRLDYRVNKWDGAFAKYIRELEARGKPVVVTGDLNCAHKEIDIHAPKTNLRSAGFTVEERESFSRLLLGEVGLVDTFRGLYPGTVAYTYFTRRFNCREKNKGWRLDYFLTSSALMPPTVPDGEDAGTAAAAGAPSEQQLQPALVPKTSLSTPWRVYDSWILQDVYGSDHLPLGLTLVKGAA